MKQVRIGLIGVGNIGTLHMGYFGRIPRLQFTAVADIDFPKAQAAAEKYGVRAFDDGVKLMDSGLVDAVLIATPHYDHAPLAIEAFRRGLHVLVEKPIAVTAAAAERAIQEYRKHRKLVFAAMFQQRTCEGWRRVKQLVEEGAVGPIQRVTWIITNWFRSQAYYDSGGWRATWAGEGGGVLLNQCPHNLDMLQWITGMPQKVHAFLGIGKYHDIEVEDEVTAYFEYPNGATGLFITSTGEAPGTNRLEIAGDRGRIVYDGGSVIDLFRTDVSVREFCRTTPESFPRVPGYRMKVEVDPTRGGQHQTITENFVAAILDGAPLIAPAEEGLSSIELANAMIYSGLTGKTVTLPMDRAGYERFLRKLAARSRFKKKVVRPAKVDMQASFQS